MDLFAVRRIKGKKPVGLFWARGFNSLRPDGLRAIVSEHCAPELCEAAFVDEAIAFVGPTNAAGRVDFKSLTDWQPLVPMPKFGSGTLNRARFFMFWKVTKPTFSASLSAPTAGN